MLVATFLGCGTVIVHALVLHALLHLVLVLALAAHRSLGILGTGRGLGIARLAGFLLVLHGALLPLRLVLIGLHVLGGCNVRGKRQCGRNCYVDKLGHD